jgi:hypothetical protein
VSTPSAVIVMSSEKQVGNLILSFHTSKQKESVTACSHYFIRSYSILSRILTLANYSILSHILTLANYSIFPSILTLANYSILSRIMFQ